MKETVSYPQGFSVGYARGDITPKEAFPIYNAVVQEVKDPLYVTCVAVCDGTQAALLMTLDLKGLTRSLADRANAMIEETFGIGRSHIVMSATHTHSAHTAVAGKSEAMLRWNEAFLKQVEDTVRRALQDLTPAEAYVGSKVTEGIGSVRRYLLADGTYKTNPKMEMNPVAHESEADNSLRTIRFAREGKKDILLMNFQTHYGLYVKAYSADFMGYLRRWAEEEMDVFFAYYSGASGNLNLSDRFVKCEKIDKVKKMWAVCKEALADEKKVNTGKVCGEVSLYPAKVLKDSAERVAQAKEIKALPDDDPRKAELMKEYGFGSRRWVQGTIDRSEYKDEQMIPFHAISFGDIAFSTSPIEQFDKNAKDVREASPFAMTFTCSLTDGHYGYVPTKEAFSHGGYEVSVCRYVPGSGEEFANEQIRLLNLCKNAD